MHEYLQQTLSLSLSPSQFLYVAFLRERWHTIRGIISCNLQIKLQQVEKGLGYA